jgi:hypothetical protein
MTTPKSVHARSADQKRLGPQYRASDQSSLPFVSSAVEVVIGNLRSPDAVKAHGRQRDRGSHDETVMAADDEEVMTRTSPRVTVNSLSMAGPIQLLVLEEFRLHAADMTTAAAHILASRHGIERSIPLLTSIEDSRDVATLRALHAGEPTELDAPQRAALDPLVSTWKAPKHYSPRMTEHSQSLPSFFRMAVTESGINTGRPPPVTLRHEHGSDGPMRAVGLVWIGTPVATNAGLLLLLGTYDDPRANGHDPSGWPLPLSRDLGVRIYESDRE